MRRNKITLNRAQELIFIHSNLYLLSKKLDLHQKGESKICDIVGDSCDTIKSVGPLTIANRLQLLIYH